MKVRKLFAESVRNANKKIVVCMKGEEGGFMTKKKVRNAETPRNSVSHSGIGFLEKEQKKAFSLLKTLEYAAINKRNGLSSLFFYEMGNVNHSQLCAVIGLNIVQDVLNINKKKKKNHTPAFSRNLLVYVANIVPTQYE
ncbi:hypothetical protein CEXT_514371 [Caerostris extrusa]|uniref:Uncharacterized protein n=1 Tax=Caerostris extrusa TaxID=172846 RepID=A0AAV4PPR2_CAEEX|nr:hypothetical protein CEXT_514371 [Caerostris extrusa]